MSLQNSFLNRIASVALATAAVLLITTGAARADVTYPGGGFAIPDNTPAGASSTIVVPDSYNVLNLTISLNITHSWVGDLIVTLQHGATTIDLIRRVGVNSGDAVGDSTNLGGTYVFTDASATRMIDAAAPLGSTVIVPVGNYHATTNSLVGNGSPTFTGETLVNIGLAFGGANVNGNWTLTISDNAPQDTGTLTSWSITVAPIPEPSTLAMLAVIGAGAVGVRTWRKRKTA